MQTDSPSTPRGSTAEPHVETGDFSRTLGKSPALRVLIVDDEPLIRWSLAAVLEGRGCAVVEAGDGETAVSKVTESPFDVILLDLRLPDSHDLTLLERVRRLAPRARVIMLTAYGAPDVIRGAIDRGAFRVINKPFELNEVAALVLEAYRSRSN